MASNPFFSGRIPQDLYDRAEKHCHDTGESKTQVLINALAAYLDHPVPIQSGGTNYHSIDARVSELEQQVGRLDDLVREVAELKHRIAASSLETDNQPDNNIDNKTEAERIPILSSDNNDSSDNKGGEITEITEQLPPDEWQYIREMNSLEILEFEEFQQHDKEKLKVKLKNANDKRSSSKSVLIEPYFFKVVGKEEGGKGRLKYDVYRRNL